MLAGGSTERARAIDATLQGAGFDVALSDTVLQQMWAKWVFLSTLAASTCLFRASIGDILAAPDGKRVIEGLLSECRAVSAHNGYPMGEDFVARVSGTLFTAGSPMTASMLRDVENHSRIEADHILGDLIRRGDAAQHDDAHVSLLRLAYNHLKAYEARQARAA